MSPQIQYALNMETPSEGGLCVGKQMVVSASRFVLTFDAHRIHVTGIFTYIWLIFMVNVGKYTIHGSSGMDFENSEIHLFFGEKNLHVCVTWQCRFQEDFSAPRLHACCHKKSSNHS